MTRLLISVVLVLAVPCVAIGQATPPKTVVRRPVSAGARGSPSSLEWCSWAHLPLARAYDCRTAAAALT